MPGVKKTMGEFKRGTLKSGSGKKVTSRKQAVAIAMSQEKKMRKPEPKSYTRKLSNTKSRRKESNPVPLGGPPSKRLSIERVAAMKRAAELKAAKKTGTPAKNTGGMNAAANQKPMKSRGSRPVTMSGKSISARKPGVEARNPNLKKTVGTTKSPGWKKGKGTY